MQLKAAVTGIGAIITGHLWLIVVAAAVPAVLACITAIILVLSVERGKRVEAIKALPPVISAVNKTALSKLIGLPHRRQRSITTTSADNQDDAR